MRGSVFLRSFADLRGATLADVSRVELLLWTLGVQLLLLLLQSHQFSFQPLLLLLRLHDPNHATLTKNGITKHQQNKAGGQTSCHRSKKKPMPAIYAGPHADALTGDSSTRVTGPSLISLTCMYAPKRPLATSPSF